MKEPHIYYNKKNKVISCSLCGASETKISDDGFDRFKFVDFEYNKNIVNPSDENPDMKWRIVCPDCKRKTSASYGPFYYYET